MNRGFASFMVIKMCRNKRIEKASFLNVASRIVMEERKAAIIQLLSEQTNE